MTCLLLNTVPSMTPLSNRISISESIIPASMELTLIEGPECRCGVSRISRWQWYQCTMSKMYLSLVTFFQAEKKFLSLPTTLSIIIITTYHWGYHDLVVQGWFFPVFFFPFPLWGKGRTSFFGPRVNLWILESARDLMSDLALLSMSLFAYRSSK